MPSTGQPLQDITGPRLLEEFRHAKASAASWDQWEHEEWAELPLEAVEWLARMLMHIEAGGRWPQQTLWGKAFFLSKVDDVTTDPMDYSILLIIPRLYRRWASVRLRDLGTWVQGWAAPEMYAGVQGEGAELAWWHVGLLRERAHRCGDGMLTGALDIFKCFDQIVPLLIKVVLGLGGLPSQVLEPFTKMMKGAQIVNMLPQGAGVSYRRRCSIPQGCPFSMMIPALLLRPWIVMNRRGSSMPRTLADDLLLVTIVGKTDDAEGRLLEFAEGIQSTISYVKDMGGRIVVN